MKKKIIVIDDEPLIPTLMKEIIEEDAELEVAGITSTTDEFMNMATNNYFDIALIDISVGYREGGLGLLKTLQEKGILFPCIILSAHDELDYALKCLRLGAKGYVNKNYICTDIIRALKTVLEGHLFVSGDRGTHILSEYMHKGRSNLA